MLIEACTVVTIRFHVRANSPQDGFMLHFLHKHLAKVEKTMAIMWMVIFVKIMIKVVPCSISSMFFLIIISSYDHFQKL
jgi:hypothetical protein